MDLTAPRETNEPVGSFEQTDNGIGTGLMGEESTNADQPLPQRTRMSRKNRNTRKKNARNMLIPLNISSGSDTVELSDREDIELSRAADAAARVARARVVYTSTLRDKSSNRKKWDKDKITLECRKHGVTFVGKHLGATVQKLTQAAIK